MPCCKTHFYQKSCPLEYNVLFVNGTFTNREDPFLSEKNVCHYVSRSGRARRIMDDWSLCSAATTAQCINNMVDQTIRRQTIRRYSRAVRPSGDIRRA
eukprot:375848_1